MWQLRRLKHRKGNYPSRNNLRLQIRQIFAIIILRRGGSGNGDSDQTAETIR
jgi:hypothetical protein